MLTMRKIKNNRQIMTDMERNYLLQLLDAYADHPEGAWLNSVPYRECRYFWCEAMNTDNGVLGARPLFGKDIYLAPIPGECYDITLIRHWIESIAPTAIHELRHLYQQKCYGKLLWSLLLFPEKLPFLYGKFIIERDALHIEERADDIILAEKHLSLFAD